MDPKDVEKTFTKMGIESEKKCTNWQCMLHINCVCAHRKFCEKDKTPGHTMCERGGETDRTDDKEADESNKITRKSELNNHTIYMEFICKLYIR